jgi:hypothetical protein
LVEPIPFNGREVMNDALSLLTEVRNACLISEEDGVFVTEDPHISEELFDRICRLINEGGDERSKLIEESLRDFVSITEGSGAVKLKAIKSLKIPS